MTYLCQNGHELQKPGNCPQDGTLAEEAKYSCRYCGYETASSKNGRCPGCEAKLELCSKSVCEVRRSANERAS